MPHVPGAEGRIRNYKEAPLVIGYYHGKQREQARCARIPKIYRENGDCGGEHAYGGRR